MMGDKYEDYEEDERQRFGSDKSFPESGTDKRLTAVTCPGLLHNWSRGNGIHSCGGAGASGMDGNGQMIFFSFGRFCWLVDWLVGWCLDCCVLLLRACVRAFGLDWNEPRQKFERVPKCSGAYETA